MIEPMKYVRIFCMKPDKDKVMKSLQKCGEIMLCDDVGSAEHEQEATQSARKAEQLIGELKKYRKKAGMLTPKHEVELFEIETLSDEEKNAVSEIEKLNCEINKAQDRLNWLNNRLSELLPWKDLSIEPSRLGKGEYATTLIGTVALSSFNNLSDAVKENGAVIDTISRDERLVYCAAAVMNDENHDFLTDCGFEQTVLNDVEGTVAENVSKIEAEIKSITSEIDVMSERLKEKVGSSFLPEIAYEHYAAESAIETAPYDETEETAVICGWVCANKLEKVKKTVDKAIDVCYIEDRDPIDGEDVPTCLKNNKIVGKFEGITNMFSVPHYGGVDPNPVMAPWYWIIFGMMMCDVGYGAIMAIAIFIGKKVLKLKGDAAKLADVMWYSSITTIISGVLFGSYFGETIHPIIFSPLENPVGMLILTIVIGAVHIFTGLIVGMVLDIKDGRPWDAIFDRLSWIILISGIGAFFIPAIRTVGIVMAIVGALIILFTAGRAKKNFIGKVTGGLVGLYGITSYLSDLLSYSRILALGLATGVVGMVMNMLAGMVQGSVFGFIMSLFIYVIGHAFNLVLGLLSAYVHSSRLQYIEFYGKFYEGNGTIFKPFSIKTKYVSLKDNGGN